VAKKRPAGTRPPVGGAKKRPAKKRPANTTVDQTAVVSGFVIFAVSSLGRTTCSSLNQSLDSGTHFRPSA